MQSGLYYGAIGAIDKLSRKLRERIGESLVAIRANDPLERVTTGSLEALRKYSQALIAIDREAPGPPTFRQWATIPAWERVKARNAPTANSGIRWSVIPPNATSRAPDRAERTKMPCE